nr:integrase, catalytic region, zinc finger, CCHC-type, peptidase aspartic, catalytic [Tanacetum cinerariifolium]
QTPGSGISNLLAVGTTFTGSGNLYCQWELSSGSGNALCILFLTAITPVLSTEEPNNSLSMGDKHLDTIPVTESDEDLLQFVILFALALMDFYELVLAGDHLSIGIQKLWLIEVGEEDLLILDVPALKIHRIKDKIEDPTLVVMELLYLLKEEHFVFRERVIPLTSVSRPQLKRNQIEDGVMLNNSQGKKQEVEDHRRNVKFSKNKTSVTACNYSLNAKTSNVNFIYVTHGKCVLNDKHDMCVLHSRNSVNSRTKMPMTVPVSTRKPKHIVNQSVATPFRSTVALESTNQKPRHITRKLYKHVTKTCSWWYPKFTPPGYKWKPKSQIGNVNPKLVEIILFVVDSGCSKHMTGNLKLLTNFVDKFMGSMKFGNDQIAPFLGYGDLVQGTVTIKRVYYIEGLNHNLFSVGQFCDADLEVAFRKSTCYICDLKGNDLLTDSREIDLYTWTHFLRSKDETHEVLIDFLRLIQRGLLAQVRIVRTDKGTEFLNKTLHAYFASEGINHQTSIARTLEQNDVVKRRNRYSTQSQAYMVFNKRTRVIVETIHVNFEKFPQMASDHISFDPVRQCQRTALDHDSLSPGPQSQENVPQAAGTVTTSNELGLLFSPMFDELLNGSTQVMSKSSAVTTADAPNQCQQQHTTSLNTQTTPEHTCQVPTQAPTVTSTKNINQAETITKNAQIEDDEFINIFCTPVQDRGETSSCHVYSSNMHTFYQRHPSEHRWTKDHPIEQVIRNPSQSVRTRRQLESDGEMCMFALTLSRTEPKNIKEAMADSAWIESMQEELHQFD